MTRGAFFIRPENGTLLAPDGFTTLAWPTEGPSYHDGDLRPRLEPRTAARHHPAGR